MGYGGTTISAPGNFRLAGEIPEVARVCTGEDERNSRRPARGIDDAEARMRMRRADHARVQQIGRRMVGNIAAGPAQERVVLLAPHRGTESEFGHLHGLPYSAGAGGPSGSGRRRLVRSAIHRLTT